MYPDDFHVDIEYNVNLNDLNFWKKYQIVHFHRNIGPDMDTSPFFIKYLQSMGIIVIGDIDDYWLPTKEHPIHQLIVSSKMNLKIIANLRTCDYVTTTTELFAQEIRKFNKNVVVLPNAIDPKEPQFNEPTLPSDRIRIGWLGGSSHLHDLKLLDGMVSKLSPNQNKIQYYLCGFDTRGVVTELNQKTGEKKQRAIRPEETVWSQYEKIFTNNYQIISPDYKNYLDKFSDGDFPAIENENYVRVWTRPVDSYARNYSKFDISLAPIKNHIFNKLKPYGFCPVQIEGYTKEGYWFYFRSRGNSIDFVIHEKEEDYGNKDPLFERDMDYGTHMFTAGWIDHEDAIRLTTVWLNEYYEVVQELKLNNKWLKKLRS